MCALRNEVLTMHRWLSGSFGVTAHSPACLDYFSATSSDFCRYSNETDSSTYWGLTEREETLYSYV